MLGNTKGIVLHSLRHGESGLITRIYTEEYGLTTFIIRSTYSKSKGSTAALYQPLTMLDLEVDIREQRQLQRIKSAHITAGRGQFLSDPLRSCLALFMAEVFMRAVQEEETSIDLYEFLDEQVTLLETSERLADLPIRFIFSLTQPLGITPDLSGAGRFFDFREGAYSLIRPGHHDYFEGEGAEAMRHYSGMRFDKISSLPKRSQRQAVLEGMLMYFRIHIPRFEEVNAYRVMKEMFR